LMYGEITWFSAWCVDNQGLYANNTVYFVPKADLWAVLSATSCI